MARYINKYETSSDYQDAITDNEYSGTTYDVANTSLIDDTRRKKYDHKITLGTGSALQSLNISGDTGFKKSTWLVGTNIASSNKLNGHKGFGTHLLKNTITNVDNVLREMNADEIMHFEYSGSTLTSITIPEGITHIYTGAFQGCINLVEVKLPSTLVYIGKHAFSGCSSLTNIVIPSSVNRIETSAFSYCTSLREVTFGDGINLYVINNCTFKRCKSLVSISLPDSVELIGWNAFSECESLEYIRLGSGLEYIKPSAFRGCFSLRNIDCSNSPNFRKENGVTIMTTYPRGGRTRDRVVHVDTALTEVVIPPVVSIHYNVLRNCRNLRTITCLGVKAPYGHTFAGCANLETLTLYITTYATMKNAFINCPNLTDLTIIPVDTPTSSYGGNFAQEYYAALSDKTEKSAFGTFDGGNYQDDHDTAIANIGLHVPSQYVQTFSSIGFNSVTAV